MMCIIVIHKTIQAKQKNYANKEDVIKRVKKIISPLGIELDRTNEIMTTTYEARQYWEFYIISGGSVVDYLYLDINIGLDRRYQWKSK